MEIWKTIKNFERYEVSNLGNVRSKDIEYVAKDNKKYYYKGKTLKLTETRAHNKPNGYYVVNLRVQGKANIRCVHRLVAEAFIPNPENKPTVNHKDGNKQNNNIDNLEWATYRENNIHAIKNNLRPSSYKGTKVIQYKDGKTYIYNSCTEAANKTNLNRSSISHCVNGTQNKTKDGSKWSKIKGQTTIENTF